MTSVTIFNHLLVIILLWHTQTLMNVIGIMVVVVKSAPIPLAHLNAAATVDISSSETVNNVEVLMLPKLKH